MFNSLMTGYRTEAAKYAAVRKQIEDEKPEINARIRAQLATRRKALADRSGIPTLGQKIRAARESRGQTQVNLAVAAGVILFEAERRWRAGAGDKGKGGAS